MSTGDPIHWMCKVLQRYRMFSRRGVLWGLPTISVLTNDKGESLRCHLEIRRLLTRPSFYLRALQDIESKRPEYLPPKQAISHIVLLAPMAQATSSSAGSKAVRQDAAPDYRTPAFPPKMNFDDKLKSLDEVPLFMRDLPTSETKGAGKGKAQAVDIESNTALEALQRLAFDGEPDGENASCVMKSCGLLTVHLLRYRNRRKLQSPGQRLLQRQTVSGSDRLLHPSDRRQADRLGDPAKLLLEPRRLQS